MTHVVCIDPGHGGYDSGAIGADGTKEKDYTLKIGLMLRDIMHEDGRFTVIMTRDGDYAPGHYEGDTSAELTERARIANDAGAEFFIAPHFNAFNHTASGVEVLTYTDTGMAGVVAQSICAQLSKDYQIANHGVQETHSTFAVIRETKMPAIIAEPFFGDNPADMAKFNDTNEMQHLAYVYYAAICAGFGIIPQAKDPSAAASTVTYAAFQGTTQLKDASGKTSFTDAKEAQALALQYDHSSVTGTNGYWAEPVIDVTVGGLIGTLTGTYAQTDRVMNVLRAALIDAKRTNPRFQ